MKKSVKNLFLIFCSFFIVFQIFAQDSFTPLSFVNFHSNLTFTLGQDTQSLAQKRTLKPFSINKYETTYKLWYITLQKAKTLGYTFQNPGQPGSLGRRGAVPTEDTENQPVTNISWYDAIIWCNALSELRGKTPCYTYDGQILRDSSDTATCDLAECNWQANGYRLPSEAEWEYAARRTKNGFQKGDMASGQKSPDAQEALLFAWSTENCSSTQIVGTAGIPFDPNNISKPATGNANGAGIFDMSGNALELCWDWFADYTFQDIYGPKFGFERVSRGGSISEYTPFLYTTDRYSFDPNENYNYIGFRIAASAL